MYKPLKSLLPLAAAVLLLLSSLHAQEKKKTVSKAARPASPASLPIDPQVLIGKLPNGLTYYIRKNSEPQKRASLYLVNKVGSLVENDDQQGLAHFLEHMAFNGTKDFPKNELIGYLQKAGVRFGADLNAYTSFDETVYQLPIPTDNEMLFERGFDILANWAGMILLETDDINAERGIILEEARARGKDAEERMQKQTLPFMFNNSRYAQRLPIGKDEILKTFTPETIRQFYNDWYRPDLQAVIAVGDFDVARVEQYIKSKFSAFENPLAEKMRPRYSVPLQSGTRVKIVTDEEYPYTTVLFSARYRKEVIKTKQDYIKHINESLFNTMLNGRLNEVRQNPAAPFVTMRGFCSELLPGLGAYNSSVVVKDGQLQASIKAMIDEKDRILKFGFTTTELARAKETLLVYQEDRWKEKDKTPSSAFVEEYVNHFLIGEATPGASYEYELYKAILPTLTLNDVNAFAHDIMNGQDRVIVVKGPHKDRNILPKDSVLLHWIDEVDKTLKPYQDNLSDQPLLVQQPKGSPIVAEKKDSLMGTTELKLANGVRIILKPTDFKNDEVSISSYSFGGTSRARDEDFLSASFGSGVISNSGAGAFDQVQLRKLLAGKNVRVNTYIDELTESIYASASQKDLETAFQLLYLYFTAPRKDEKQWRLELEQTRIGLENKGVDPGSVFQDTIVAVLNNRHPRRMPLQPAQLNTLSLDKAFAFYKDRFADASDFTFVIVGNLKLEKLKPLLEKYMGGLPSTKRQENYRDLDIHIPSGTITKIVHKGLEDKSEVRLVFSGTYTYSEQNNIQLEAMRQVLDLKLVERLREKESGVYSPGVQIGYHKLPQAAYTCVVSFTCATENIDKLINATLDEISTLKQHGATNEAIEKFRSEEKRVRELQLKDNGFWSYYLTEQSRLNENPHQVLDQATLLQQVTTTSTKTSFTQYLNTDNLIRLILMPERKNP